MIPFKPPSLTWILVPVVVAVASAVALLKRRQGRTLRGFRRLSGPVPLPIVGNFLSIDRKKPWVTYAQWAARYGDIFTIRMMKEDIIVINSKKIASDILDQKSAINSDRPHYTTTVPFGWDFNFAWDSYGERWRAQRRIFHQVFRAEAALTFRPVQLRKTHQLLLDILSTPHAFCDHIKRFSAGVIMSIVYDYEVAPENDYFVELFTRGTILALDSLTVEGSSLPNAFPFVFDLPEWFPGAGLRRRAINSKRCAMQMVAEPFEHAMKREAMGSHAPAMALDMLRKPRYEDPSQLQLLKNTCATAFIAGTETTSVTLICFMLAMLQHPEVQQRAQAEIDSVVGTDRLPNFDDRPNLPYIEAILLEVLRVYPPVPLGVPHTTIADDVYEDIFIPKGSILMANIWGIYHNEDTYPEPDVFKPERFLVDGKLSGGKAIDTIAFGFGRRVCPGRYTADGSVWAAMVSILYVFKITKAVDEQGNEIGLKPTNASTTKIAPDSFHCSITPRRSNVDICKLAIVDLLD